MGRIIAAFSMSLDGFVADLYDSVGPLFDWYGNGDVEVKWPGMGMVSRTSAASAGYLRETIADAGAVVVGRRIFDHTNGWGGSHPLNVPVFVVTHRVPDGWPRDDAPFTFVTSGGVGQAIALAKVVAGDKAVGVAGPNIAQQCLDAGLLDEVRIDLVPVLLGTGIPFFDEVQGAPVRLGEPTVIIGDRVTHLRFLVLRETFPR